MRLGRFSRIIILFVAYCAAFFLLVLACFSGQNVSTMRIGSFSITGGVVRQADGDDNFLIEDFARITFGGMNFLLSNGDDAPLLVNENGTEMLLAVHALRTSGDSAHILLSDGVELVFYTRSSVNLDGLLISAALPPSAKTLYIPYSLEKHSTLDNRTFFEVKTSNASYTFDKDAVKGNLIELDVDDPVVFYHVISKTEEFNPMEYTVRGSLEKSMYDEVLKQHFDAYYNAWEKAVQNAADEETVVAFLAESCKRSAYARALTQIPESFRASPLQTYISAPYLGGLSSALRALAAQERVDTAGLAAQVRDNPRILLSDDYSINHWALLGNSNFPEERAVYARDVPVTDIDLEETVGILKGYVNWQEKSPSVANPFQRLIPHSLGLLSAALIKNVGADNVFVKKGGVVSLEFNIRAGLALSAYGEAVGDSGWAGLGRSLVLSSLSLVKPNERVPRDYVENRTSGGLEALEAEHTASSAYFYSILTPEGFYPHAASLDSAQNGVWAWTVSPNMTATFQNNVLDIAVKFPVGSTHHLLVRRVAPFSKIQLRDMDYRSDPRFEQYNSPGWAYSSSEQTLLVKLVHRSEVEHIRIFY